jgi:MFS family permease
MGMIAVLLAGHLAAVGFPADVVGRGVAAGLAGNAVAVAAATLLGDRFGGKRILLVLAALGAGGAALAAVASTPAALASAAFLGMLHGMRARPRRRPRTGDLARDDDRGWAYERLCLVQRSAGCPSSARSAAGRRTGAKRP